ncbi:hypothetical protein BHM03_00018952 [Ensete ventricosum]|nr:hypothetical protein BHM03_00018952 [Ensete ventricosum]
MKRERAANRRLPSYAYVARVCYPAANKSQSASDGWMRPGRDARIRVRSIETLGRGWNPGIPFEACRYLRRSPLLLAGSPAITASPLLVVEVSTSKTGKHGHAKCHFVGIDIFNTKKLEDIVPSSHNCDVSNCPASVVEYLLLKFINADFPMFCRFPMSLALTISLLTSLKMVLYV